MCCRMTNSGGSWFPWLLTILAKIAIMAQRSWSMPRDRVLLVDDQPKVLASYSRALASAGFEVTEAGSGDEALRRLERSPFDVVLTDLLVPKISGLAFLERLRAFSPALPFIVMVDKQSNEIAVEAAELGALQLLVKPIDLACLKRTVGRAVRLRR